MTEKSKALDELIAACKDMLVVWEGVAHPGLAYSRGSPAARIRAALAELGQAET